MYKEVRQKKSPSVETERLLTIACHMKKNLKLLVTGKQSHMVKLS